MPKSQIITLSFSSPLSYIHRYQLMQILSKNIINDFFIKKIKKNNYNLTYIKYSVQDDCHIPYYTTNPLISVGISNHYKTI